MDGMHLCNFGYALATQVNLVDEVRVEESWQIDWLDKLKGLFNLSA